MTWRIHRLDPASASDSTLQRVHEFMVAMDAERYPDDPPRSLEYTLRNFRSFALITSQKAIPFYAWLGETVVGKAFIAFGLDDENSHLLWVDIEVLAGHRGQGIGAALLSEVVTVAEVEKRDLLMGTTDAAIPAGEAFARKIGATIGVVDVTSELRIADLDPGLLTTWTNAAPHDSYRLLTWRGSYPDEFLEPMAALHEVMNSAPRGELEYEDERVTPEDIREAEAYRAARGVESWTMVAQHRHTRELAGFTQVRWHPDNERLLTQGVTVVEPPHRRRGLGRWLKASMIELVLHERQYVDRIRTENAEMNEAMLTINHALGFRHYKTQTEWQVKTERVKEFLATEEQVDGPRETGYVGNQRPAK